MDTAVNYVHNTVYNKYLIDAVNSFIKRWNIGIKLSNEDIHNLYPSTNNRAIKTQIIRQVGHVTCMRETLTVYKILIVKSHGKTWLGKDNHKWGSLWRSMLQRNELIWTNSGQDGIADFCEHIYEASRFITVVLLTSWISNLTIRPCHSSGSRFSPRRPRFRAQVSPCVICSGQRDTGTGFSPSPSVFPCQYNSTAAPYSLIYHRGGGGC
jgi:hypothetical protein